MGKVSTIKKSRKEFKCDKCGKMIPKGSSYLRGELNFSQPIIRCTDCGLKGYEVTTSDYIRDVGAIVEDWETVFDGVAIADMPQAISDSLSEIYSELEDKLNNMPDGLKEGDTGMLLQERMDGLESAIGALDSIDGPDEDDEDFDSEAYEEGVISEIVDALSEIAY